MVRTITIEEIDRFLREPEEPENIERVRTFLERQLETGETKPEWCYVIDGGDRFHARVVCFMLPGSHPEYSITFFSFDKELSFETRCSFLRDVAVDMHKNVGATILIHELRTSSDKYDGNVVILSGAGFFLSSSRLRYTLDISTFEPQTQSPIELIERSCIDIGTQEFIKVLQDITYNSIDTEDILRIREYGAGDAARHFFEVLSSRDNTLERWKIYYTSSGEFVGLVTPQLIGDGTEIGTIGYLGVNPNMRSKGFGGFILTRGISILVHAGATEMVDECDDANPSAICILERNGYKRQYKKEIWKLNIV